jgi:hypothetical protein
MAKNKLFSNGRNVKNEKFAEIKGLSKFINDIEKYINHKLLLLL